MRSKLAATACIWLPILIYGIIAILNLLTK